MLRAFNVHTIRNKLIITSRLPFSFGKRSEAALIRHVTEHRWYLAEHWRVVERAMAGYAGTPGELA